MNMSHHKWLITLSKDTLKIQKLNTKKNIIVNFNIN